MKEQLIETILDTVEDWESTDLMELTKDLLSNYLSVEQIEQLMTDQGIE